MNSRPPEVGDRLRFLRSVQQRFARSRGECMRSGRQQCESHCRFLLQSSVWPSNSQHGRNRFDACNLIRHHHLQAIESCDLYAVRYVIKVLNSIFNRSTISCNAYVFSGKGYT